MKVHLTGVYCPHCSARISTVALPAGPSLIHHRRDVRRSGERERCKGQFVAVPQPGTGRVDLIPVDGRHEADAVLQSATARWYQALVEHLGDPVSG